MKKKIFLTVLIIAMLICAMAISASAKREENYDATFTLGNTVTFNHFEKWYYNEGKSYVRKKYTNTNVAITFVDENGAPITTVPMWEYDENQGKYYSLVWYISDYKYTWSEGTYTDDNVGTQTYKIYETAIYTLSKVRAVDLRYYTYNGNRSNSNIESWATARTLKVLEGIYLTNGTPDDTTDDIKLQDAVGIGRDNDNYGYEFWEGQFAGTGDKIVVGNFRDCDFECDMEGNYGTSNTWSSAYHLQCIWYPDTVKYIHGGISSSAYEIDLGDGIEIVACQVLRDNKNIKHFTIPNSLLFLNNEAFRGTDLTSLVIGESLVVHGGSPYLYTGAADYTYVSKNALNMTSALTALLNGKDSTFVIYFDGDADDAADLQAYLIEKNSGFNGRVTLYDYNITQERETGNKYCAIFYNYNRCEAFYRNQHEKDGNACVINCERCGLAGKMEENPEHNYLYVYAYGAGYNKAGTTTYTCQNAGCIHNGEENKQTGEALLPIFTFLGYSTDMATKTELAVGYRVDTDALRFFEEMAGVSVTYGVIGVVTDNLKKNETETYTPIEAAEAGVNVVVADVPTGVATFNLKIQGFSEQYYDLGITMGAFIITTDESEDSVTEYLQDEQGSSLYSYTLRECIDEKEAEQAI